MEWIFYVDISITVVDYNFFSWNFVFLAFSLISNNKYLLITYFLHRDWLCWTRCIDFCSDFDWCLFSDFVHSTLIRWLFVFHCFIFLLLMYLILVFLKIDNHLYRFSIFLAMAWKSNLPGVYSWIPRVHDHACPS